MHQESSFLYIFPFPAPFLLFTHHNGSNEAPGLRASVVAAAASYQISD